MGWIKERIISEYEKHPTLDWARLAEIKIVKQLGEDGHFAILGQDAKCVEKEQ